MLTPEDQAEVLQALRVVGGATSTVDFARRVSEELLRLVPGISSSYNETNLATRRVAALLHPDPGREYFQANAGRFERHMRENPIVAHHEATGEGDVVTWADLDPEGLFFDTPLYREFYAPRGIRGQIAFLLPAPPGIHVALVVSRDRPGFSDRERELLSALRLQLVNVYRLVTHADSSRRLDAALADDGWSVVLVDDSGTVIESNDLAMKIGAVAGVDLAVGARLADGELWSQMSGPRSDLWATSRPALPTKVPRQYVPFEARLLRSSIGPHVLWIREPSQVRVPDAVGLGLTARQAQVALLLVDGLTNRQIARRLGIADGTVRKHLEVVFERLGVNSRAAAVARLQTAAARTGRHSTRAGRANPPVVGADPRAQNVTNTRP
jgi:DNA-binding CsgD family transcriptional regulator